MKKTLKSVLKQAPFLYVINAHIKASLCKRRYTSLRTYYEKIANAKMMSYSETDVACQVGRLLTKRNINPKPIPKGKLRVFYIGTDRDQDWGGIIQGLEKFGEVITFECEPGKYGQIPTVTTKNLDKNNGRRLISQVRELLKSGPIHTVIGQMWASTMAPEALQTVRQIGVPVVNICMEDRHAFRGKKVNGKWSGTSRLIGSIDLVWAVAKECCLWYQIEGCPAIYLPEASDQELYKPSWGQKLYDVSFVGGNYGIRTKIVKAVERRGVNVICYGKDWPNGRIDMEKLPELFDRSHIVLGISTLGHCSDFYGLKIRDFDGPMSGSLYITHDNPDLYELYEVGKEIVTYRTPEECADKIVYYLNHPDEAKAIGKAGRERALREHTWEKRFERILKTLGLLP